MAKLNRAVDLVAFGVPITLPKGTRVIEPLGPRVVHGPRYAVESVKLLSTLTGNTHDPVYRFVYVPDDAVDEDENGQ